MANWVVKIFTLQSDAEPARTFVLGAPDEDTASEVALDAMGDCARADLRAMVTPLVLPTGTFFELPGQAAD